jgi:hypothetical protein
VETKKHLTQEQIRSFREGGYLVVERELVDNFMQMHAGVPIPGCFEPADSEEADCHYVGSSSERISKWHRPILTMDGEEVRIEESAGEGPCGTEDAGVHRKLSSLDRGP